MLFQVGTESGDCGVSSERRRLFPCGRRSRTLGILLDQLTNPFGAPLAEALEQEASAHGYQCFVGCTQYDGLRKLEYVNRFLEHQVEGLFLLTVWLGPTVKEGLNSALTTDTAVVTGRSSLDQRLRCNPRVRANGLAEALEHLKLGVFEGVCGLHSGWGMRARI